jgi:F-type H+-transporting ATPase subunit epsilon
MKLIVTTPLAVVVDASEVAEVRAEDETGAFGVRPGHADFVTALTISVITWRDQLARERHVAVAGGVLSVRDGDRVEVATRAAVDEETLSKLGVAVVERLRGEAAEEMESRSSATRLHLAALRQIQRYLEARQRPGSQGAPSGFGESSEDGGA